MRTPKKKTQTGNVQVFFKSDDEVSRLRIVATYCRPRDCQGVSHDQLRDVCVKFDKWPVSHPSSVSSYEIIASDLMAYDVTN